MTMKILKHGEDFGDRPDHFPAEFGFHGSIAPKPGASDMAGGKHSGHLSEHSGGYPPPEQYAEGGMHHEHPHGHQPVRTEHHEDGRITEHHAHGGMTVHHPDGHVTHHHHDGSPAHHAGGGEHHEMHLHPHGHDVVKVEHHADGRIVHHHSHGGHTVHHRDGRITHHHEDGSPVMAMPHQGVEHMHDSSEYAHGGMHGGDVEQDKAMVRKGIRQHEDHEHGGEHTDLELARGGMPRLPRSIRPAAARMKSPIERKPRNPERNVTPRNEEPAGHMGYGVEPSAEPDDAGSDQDIPQLARGGFHPQRRR